MSFIKFTLGISPNDFYKIKLIQIMEFMTKLEIKLNNCDNILVYYYFTNYGVIVLF